MDDLNKGYSAIYYTVAEICKDLTDDEMAGIGMRLVLGQSFKGSPWEDKIGLMLDETGHMHQITGSAFSAVYDERFPQQ